MFIAAVCLGIYSYLIFFLGIAGFLYKDLVAFLTAGFIFALVFWKRESLRNIQIQKFSKGFLFLFSLFFLQAAVNFIGVLGPELGFDALWYHLTLPKIYLTEHAVSYIPGGLLYYSAMPKLAEMLFIGGLAIGDEMLVKLTHFIFGLLSCLALYKIQRKFFTSFISMLGVVVFYANLVVAWESSASYIDLVRTFYEIMAVWGFINWLQTKDKKSLFLCALMIGFAITTKLLALGSLGIFTILLLTQYHWRTKIKENIIHFIRLIIPFWLIALFVPLPWLIFSYVHTGNPFYPLFSPVLQEHSAKIFSLDLLNPLHFLQTMWNIAVKAADPISPVYIIVLPIILLLWKKLLKMKVFFLYALLSLFLWYITAKVEGSRLLLPGLTVLSILVAACVNEILKTKNYQLVGKVLILIIIFIGFISIGYRFVANKKYLPFIFGQQTKQQFLTEHLNFSFGDFYDVDGYFQKNIKPTDTVLLHGFHNLYYIDFPFIDWLDAQKGEKFNYVATLNAGLPKEFSHWKLVYQNDKTLVKLYKKE